MFEPTDRPAMEKEHKLLGIDPPQHYCDVDCQKNIIILCLSHFVYTVQVCHGIISSSSYSRKKIVF